MSRSATTLLAAALAAGIGIAALSASQENVSMFRGDPTHSGVYPSAALRHFGGLQWRVQTGGMVQSSAALHDGTLYIGSGDGRLYALDAATGAERWQFRTRRAISSTPAVADGLVFVGSRDNAFWAVDARTGEERWRLETGRDVPFPWGFESGDLYTSSPTWAAGTLYFGSGDGHLYAVDPRSGKVRWRFATGGRVRTSPAVANGRVYAGSADGTLYALDASDGQELWRYHTEGHALESREFGFDRRTIQASPAVADGRVFIGSRDGFLYAVDAATGKEAWRVDHRMSWVNTSPAIADGVVYAGSSDERFLQAVDARTGRELWRLPTERPVWSSPAVAGDMVYAGDGSGTVYAVDRASGRERWRYRSGRRIFSSPVLADGVLYVGNDDGGVYAIRGGESPLVRAVFWDSTLALASRVVAHRELRDYLVERGYEALDTRGLERFLTGRLADRAPSVVVFSMDHLPQAVAPVAADTVLFRRYLDAGGKVVWPGIPPLVWPRDPATGETPEYIHIDRAATARLLGVDHARSNFDNYGAVVTDDGRRWGLSGWWDSNWGVDPSSVTETLATDDNGLASSWVRSYGGAPGTGFVRVYGGNWSAGGPTASFAAVQAVAEYRPVTPGR